MAHLDARVQPRQQSHGCCICRRGADDTPRIRSRLCRATWPRVVGVGCCCVCAGMDARHRNASASRILIIVVSRSLVRLQVRCASSQHELWRLQNPARESLPNANTRQCASGRNTRFSRWLDRRSKNGGRSEHHFATFFGDKRSQLHSCHLSAGLRRAATASMRELKSTPVAAPLGPVLIAAARVRTPVPHATSRTR